MALPSKKAVATNFASYRQQVLSSHWAKNINVDEVRSFLNSLHTDRFAANVLATKRRDPVLQPRGGTPRFDKQKRLSEALSGSGADFIPLTIDSHTRHNDYDRAEALLRKSEEDEEDYLNGFPLINHGHKVARELYETINKPVSLRHGTPDARLLAEVAIASGITEIEGGGLCYCVPYSASFPLDMSLLYWQYVDRVCAEYSTPEKPIHRESFGPLSATMVPPVVVAVIEIIELLLAAEQGVKSFAVSFGQTGSIAQDIALAKVLREKARYFCDLFGFHDVKIYLVYHQWMGAFPKDRGYSNSLISLSTVLGRFVGADKIVVKTKDEAFGIPTIESNCEAVKATRYLLNIVPPLSSVVSDSADVEISLLTKQVDEVLNAIFALPGEAFWESVHQAVIRGFIDIPFTPHESNANLLVTQRDALHNIRIKGHGNLPLSEDSIAHEKKLLRENATDDEGFMSKLLRDINLMAWL